MPTPKTPAGRSKISTIPTLPRISEHNHATATAAATTAATTTTTTVVVMVVIPPDGGFAWAIVAASFLINFLIDGIVYSFGMFLEPLALTLSVSQTQATLIGSLQMGVYYLSGPFTCAAVNRFGFRWVAATGAIVAAVGTVG